MTKTTDKRHKIVVLNGDGIGPEVTAESIKVLKVVGDCIGCEFDFEHKLIGGAAIDATGNPLPDDTLAACKSAAAILLGAVGGPKWATGQVRPEQGLLAIRKALGLFANIRPVSVLSEDLVKSSPIKAHVLKGVDMVFVRELTGGIYFGKREEATDDKPEAFDTMEYSEEEITRATRIAAQMARKRRSHVTSVDKANVLATSRLWRKTVDKVMSTEFPDVTYEHVLVDAAAMHLLTRPSSFDVILCSNLFGDILTDEASVLGGSLGLAPSASMGSSVSLYEPIHGSAPDIAGKGVANPIGSILSAAMLLRHSLHLEDAAKAVEKAVTLAVHDGLRSPDICQHGETPHKTSEIGDAIVKHLSTILKRGRRGLNLCEKIICHHAIGLQKPEVKPGDSVCVKVDWTLASELTWKGMEKTYDQMKRPKVWRNDRFWLAVDHTVDPRINHLPKPKGLIEASEKFASEAGIVDYQPPNTTILHTDFYRERAQPGMLICGADSHSCSTGGLGTFSVGLGAADVVLPLVTGETWFTVPETVQIKFTGKLKFGITGKDTMLYTLAKLKRNTVAFERAVEYTGNIGVLSADSRFAIANMTTEFGGIAGVFEADKVTQSYVNKREDTKHKSQSVYFKADPDAEYAETHEIKLEEVDSMVALYPSPDNGVHVSEVDGKALDGCFIGACTTGEEDLILGGLVLEAALNMGLTPTKEGQRRVTPGSVGITAKLEKLGLLEVYKRAGYEIGAPGCSYCLGIAADKAGEGEVWLSSQNRNFQNRMGKGSIANLASAATVAASSLSMKITNPQTLLNAIDKQRYNECLAAIESSLPAIQYSEPSPDLVSAGSAQESSNGEDLSINDVITGKAIVFGDNIDTDAIIPAEFMPGIDDTDLGTHCFEYVRPDFREKVKNGFTITVAGIGFGSGSSREEAPRALKGCGVQAVIAKSFAFIYARNQPNMSLLGIVLKDEKFYELASEGEEITVDVPKRTITVKGEQFKFSLSLIEERLLAGGGVTNMYDKYKEKLFRVAVAPPANAASCGSGGDGCGSGGGGATTW